MLLGFVWGDVGDSTPSNTSTMKLIRSGDLITSFNDRQLHYAGTPYTATWTVSNNNWGVTLLALNPVGAPLPSGLTYSKGEVLYNGTQSSAGTTAGTGSPSNLTDANELTGWLTSTFNAWVSVDCGAATQLTRIRLTPGCGYEDGIRGAIIQGSNDSAFSSGSSFFTISTRGVTGVLLNEYVISMLSPGFAYRYYRVLINNRAWHIDDLDFIGKYVAGVVAQPVAPVITPPGGNFDQPVRVRISCLTSDVLPLSLLR
jgi:hypothetical protein